MPVQRVGLANHADQAFSQTGGVFRTPDRGLDNRELVRAKPRDRVALPHRRAQPPRHRLQQPVANGVTQRVIDSPEAVEIDEQDRDMLPAAPRNSQRVLEMLSQQYAVRQRGEAVMLRHEGETCLGAFPLGDVDQNQQNGRLTLEHHVTHIDRHIDQRAIGPDVLPNSRGAPLHGVLAAPWRRGFERLKVGELERLEIRSGVAVLFQRGIIGIDDARILARAHHHWNRTAFKQSPELRVVRPWLDPGARVGRADPLPERWFRSRLALPPWKTCADPESVFFRWPIRRHFNANPAAFCGAQYWRNFLTNGVRATCEFNAQG